MVRQQFDLIAEELEQLGEQKLAAAVDRIALERSAATSLGEATIEYSQNEYKLCFTQPDHHWLRQLEGLMRIGPIRGGIGIYRSYHH